MTDAGADIIVGEEHAREPPEIIVGEDVQTGAAFV